MDHGPEPLTDRILRGSRALDLPHFVSSSFVRPSQYKCWTDENMMPLELVRKREMSVREAAIRFNVPRSTLGDHASDRIQHGSVS